MGNVNLTNGQTFQRVEDVVGVGVLERNNGVAVADYDGDNDLDIFVVANAIENNTSEASKSKLFRNNNNGTFTDVTESSGLTNLLTSDDVTSTTLAQAGHKLGVFWGDINNDGFPDILFTHVFKIQLFLNQGNGTFLDITESSGLPEVNGCVNTGASWLDYNNDGFLDVYISDWNRCAGNTFYRNNGNNTFTNVTEESGLIEPVSRFGYTPFPFDINEDGWMDLIVANDLDRSNYLYINQNGISFTDQASTYGLDNGIDDMAIVINDFDNDNDFDFFITGIDENSLLVNNGNNNFEDKASEFDLIGLGWAWGARFADFDLDGDEDLYILNGYSFEGRGDEQNRYYKNLIQEGQNTFQDESNTSGLAEITKSVEALDFDYDNDGDLDLFVTNGESKSFFYENKLLNFDESSTLKWFKVSLEGTTSNRSAIGTKLELSTSEGNIIRYFNGIGFLSQSMQPVHFGLPSNATISQLKISWPSGLEETLESPETNTFIKATEGNGYTVLNIQPSQKIYGCTDPDSCNFNPIATLDNGTCEYLTSKIIDGSDTSSFYKTETYTYPLEEGAIAIWEIEGGELLEGQNSETVTVRWHIEPEGRLLVREFNNSCLSKTVVKTVQLNAQNIPENTSIARIWNEALLEAIRNDFARPTVHARNLFHTSVAVYDAWAVYSKEARPYLIGNTVKGFSSELLSFTPLESIAESRKKAISYAAYRLLSHRFRMSPGAQETQERLDLIMEQLGYDLNFTDSNYTSGDARALGNYIAKILIAYGNQDGSREQSDYDNAFYQPINEALNPNLSDDFLSTNPNRWQPLSLNGFVDQSGNLIEGDIIDFLSPEWGAVNSFALTDNEKTIYNRDGNSYSVFHDPDTPPYLNENDRIASEAYKWGFSMVSIWQSHLDTSDNVFWDISPKAIGNIDFNNLPTSYEAHPNFYKFFEGGDISLGRNINPITQQPYQEQIVPRGDYARVLAEFWADGPDSETPPGHWFTILNYVNDNPLLERRFTGTGVTLSPLEWDVKSYFILGGAMHDAAIAAWSIKGWYDYIRPISAIRYMASRGQSSDVNAPNYNSEGIALIPDYIELVSENDPLSGINGEHINKIKLYTWKGHDFIGNTETDVAGVGWILAENWWPYQRPNFVTPPFAGYVSGHSTYSRAAAEVLTAITGSEFFPGGLGEFKAEKNKFLVFEEGPSVDVNLQWATYRDASDQCSLSRIWGGIHPPADDIPGRIIGKKVGIEAFNFAVPYFSTTEKDSSRLQVFPSPVLNSKITILNSDMEDRIFIFDMIGRQITPLNKIYNSNTNSIEMELPENLASGFYIVRKNGQSKIIVVKKGKV